MADDLVGRLAAVHRGPALTHQWNQLEATGAIDCFAVVAGASDGFVVRDFTSDSDVYKWLDAVARCDPATLTPDLQEHFDSLVGLIEAAQADDGYLNTWIQGFFPERRFQNLEVEHECYTLGHLIEAGVSHYESTGSDRLLTVARRAADLLVEQLRDVTDPHEDGHEEIEIALIRLARVTGEDTYLDLARRVIDRRGTTAHHRRRFAAAHLRTGRRLLHQLRQRRAYQRSHPGWTAPTRAAGLDVSITPNIVVRTMRAFLSGRQWQNDAPVSERTVPSGHAVGFFYLQTALAMLARDQDDPQLRAITEAAWDAVVQGHLFVHGGAGAYPGIEGFADPYDLDPERAYAETCGSLAGTFWNRELGLLTGDACYDDLLEWQLFNGVAVGMSLDGQSYAYNNPLQVPAGFARRPWYPIPCCPSNLSRAWVSLPSLMWSRAGDEVRLHQLYAGVTQLDGVDLRVESEVPWGGRVTVQVGACDGERPQRLAFRMPSWADGVEVSVDERRAPIQLDEPPVPRATAPGLDPWQARWGRVDLPDGPCTVALEFTMPFRLLRQDHRVPKVGGKVAVARGPLLFTLEAIDQIADVADCLTALTIDPTSLDAAFDPNCLGGVMTLRATTPTGDPLRLVPYFVWGNRGSTAMTPFVATPT